MKMAAAFAVALCLSMVAQAQTPQASLDLSTDLRLQDSTPATHALSGTNSADLLGSTSMLTQGSAKPASTEPVKLDLTLGDAREVNKVTFSRGLLDPQATSLESDTGNTNKGNVLPGGEIHTQIAPEPGILGLGALGVSVVLVLARKR